jgi:TPR repeat protein
MRYSGDNETDGSKAMRHTLLGALFGAVLAIGISQPAAADYWVDFEAGVQAYAEGEHAEAIRRFRPLAERGDHRAQYWLGMIYFEGRGVPKDDLRAYMWLTLAAGQGNRGARAGRDGIARRLSDAQIAEADRLAAAWLPAQ